MPSPGDFEFHDPKGGIDLDHKCYVTGWGRRTESESHYQDEYTERNGYHLPD
jgi:hypothetical protein